MAERQEIRVYRADTEPLRDTVLFSKAYRLASQRRRDKIDRLVFESDKCLSLGAELLLMRACRDFGISYAAERITEDEKGKPFFFSGSAQFNLSHSDTRVMCAMAHVPIGCDVQQIANAQMKLAQRFFHEKEYAALNALPEGEARDDLFYRFWTLKESFIKCTGHGLFLPLKEFCIDIAPQGVSVEQSASAASYRFFENAPGDGFRYALCARVPEEGGRTLTLTGQEVFLDMAFMQSL